MIVIDTKAAVRNRQGNRPFSVWSIPKPETAGLGYEATDEGNGGQRVYAGRLRLSDCSSPKFRIRPNSSYFTAGSCFAREIERAMYDAGQSVQSWNPTRALSNDLFHRYNTFSIINDFEFAAGRQYDEANVFAIGGGKFADYSGYGSRDSLQELLTMRREIIDIHKNAFSSDVIILTLGLVEAWYDKSTNTYLNTSPYPLFHKHGDRFELRITDYDENKTALTTLLKYLFQVNPKVKIVLTVSPVPFSDTFSGQDVVIANTYSKSVLRAVAQDIAREFDYVDYFPSYEIVMFSDPLVAWYPDRRHVQRAHVEHIMAEFMENYLTTDGV